MNFLIQNIKKLIELRSTTVTFSFAFSYPTAGSFVVISNSCPVAVDACAVVVRIHWVSLTFCARRDRHHFRSRATDYVEKTIWGNCHSSFSQIDKIGNNDNIGIRGFTMWKISSGKMLPPSVGIEPGPLITSDSKSNTILSTLTWHVLLRRSLNFYSSTTWCLDLDDLRRINRAWLYKEPKVSVLQANVKLV